MIEKTLKTISGSNIRICIPEQLSDVTLGQMIAMQDAPHLNDFEAISILSGIAVNNLKQIKKADELQVFGGHIMGLARQIKHLYNSDKLPEKVTLAVNGKSVQINVIKNLSVEPAGAFMAARDIIAGEIAGHIETYGEKNWQDNFNPSLKACSLILAHYFYCRVTGKAYDEYAVDHFTETIKTMRVTEAMPIAKHFFTSYPGLSKPKTGFWHQARQLWNNVREYRRLKNLSTSTP